MEKCLIIMKLSQFNIKFPIDFRSKKIIESLQVSAIESCICKVSLYLG